MKLSGLSFYLVRFCTFPYIFFPHIQFHTYSQCFILFDQFIFLACPPQCNCKISTFFSLSFGLCSWSNALCIHIQYLIFKKNIRSSLHGFSFNKPQQKWKMKWFCLVGRNAYHFINNKKIAIETMKNKNQLILNQFFIPDILQWWHMREYRSFSVARNANNSHRTDYMEVNYYYYWGWHINGLGW